MDCSRIIVVSKVQSTRAYADSFLFPFLYMNMCSVLWIFALRFSDFKLFIFHHMFFRMYTIVSLFIIADTNAVTAHVEYSYSVDNICIF